MGSNQPIFLNVNGIYTNIKYITHIAHKPHYNSYWVGTANKNPFYKIEFAEVYESKHPISYEEIKLFLENRKFSLIS